VSVITVLAMALPPNWQLVELYVQWLPICGLLLAVLGLLAIEQMYRNASIEAIPGLRWFCLGMGGLFVAELVGLAQTLLVGKTPTELWTARAGIYAVCALAIGHGAKRMPDWSFGLLISRDVVF